MPPRNGILFREACKDKASLEGNRGEVKPLGRRKLIMVIRMEMKRRVYLIWLE
jgi:hypothetical protein